MSSYFSAFSLLLLGLFFASCHSPASSPASATENTYLYLGHPYDWRSENRLDPRLELLDYSHFQGVWLGGDVCARTSKSPSTLSYLDSLFDLKSATTYWSWGNHDLLEGQEQRLLNATARHDYYTENLDGLQIIVLNTNLFWHHEWRPPTEDCERKAAQVAWLHQVLDTVQAASQLVILHHHGLLNEYKATGGNWGNVDAPRVRVGCEAERDFTQEFYPQLVAVRQKGIPVILVSGDVGMRSKGYAIKTPEGIDVLGSGINNSLDMAYPPDYVTNFNPDSVLVFRHHPAKRQLDWAFIRLNDLVKKQLSATDYEQLSASVQMLLDKY